MKAFIVESLKPMSQTLNCKAGTALHPKLLQHPKQQSPEPPGSVEGRSARQAIASRKGL